MVSVGLSANINYDNSITSNNHRTYQISAMQVGGTEHLELETQQVTFEPIDDSEAMYGDCEGQCLQETITFETNDYLNITHKLIIYLDGVQYQGEAFDVSFTDTTNNMRTDYLDVGLGETEVDVKVWLNEELSFEEMGADVTVELRFYIEE